MGRFKVVLILSVVGCSSLSMRCVVKGRDVEAFKRRLVEVLFEYIESIPYGSKVNCDYWGNGSDIAFEVLDSVLHFRGVKYVK